MIRRQRHDIIEKLIADLARVFARLMGLDAEVALQEIQEYYAEWLGLDESFLASLTPENILDRLIHEKEMDFAQLELFAELLAREGEIIFQKQQFSRSSVQLQKALVIFDHVEQESQLYSINRRNTISKIKQQLANSLNNE